MILKMMNMKILDVDDDDDDDDDDDAPRKMGVY